MAEKSYDVAIIGSGSGGYTAAIRAAQLNFKVALIEKSYIGGVCLNTGCIPTKAILSSTDALDIIRNASTYGIDVENITFDLEKIIDRKDKIIQTLRNSLKNLILSNKIDIIEGEAKFLSENTLEIKDKTINAKNIIIATGSNPIQLENIKIDHKKIHDSTSILNLKKLPKSLIIIGGGYIGCEFASFYSRLGVKLTIIEAFPSILFSQGQEISKQLTKSFIAADIDIKTNSKVKNIETMQNSLKVQLENNQELESEIVLVAIGRKPNSSNLNLEKINIKKGKRDEILVDEKMRTSHPHIYAIGDVIGKWMLAHTASHEAIVAVDTIANIENKMTYSYIPSIIFTKPEIAIIGLTIEKANEKNIEIEVGKFPFTALGKAHALSEKQGYVEVIIDKKTKIILGATVFGTSASVLIAEMALAITNKLTIKAVLQTIHAHPTLSESWVEAIDISQNTPLNFPPGLKI
jgi:dihydrolipoamide dehydrogenase